MRMDPQRSRLGSDLKGDFIVVDAEVGLQVRKFRRGELNVVRPGSFRVSCNKSMVGGGEIPEVESVNMGLLTVHALFAQDDTCCGISTTNRRTRNIHSGSKGGSSFPSRSYVDEVVAMLWLYIDPSPRTVRSR